MLPLFLRNKKGKKLVKIIERKYIKSSQKARATKENNHRSRSKKLNWIERIDSRSSLSLVVELETRISRIKFFNIHCFGFLRLFFVLCPLFETLNKTQKQKNVWYFCYKKRLLTNNNNNNKNYETVRSVRKEHFLEGQKS